MPALTAAATAAAPEIATPVLWVTALAATTASTRRGMLSKSFAIPTGAIRMAAPFVVPNRPDSVTGVPAATASTAAFVDGPSRSCDPRARIPSSHSTSSAARCRGVDRAAPRDQVPGEQQGELGVVGDGACAQSVGERMRWIGRLERRDGAPALRDRLPRQLLRRHPERIADREPDQRALGPLQLARHADAPASILEHGRDVRDLDQRGVEGHRVERALVVGVGETGARVGGDPHVHPGIRCGERRRQHAAVRRDAGEHDLAAPLDRPVEVGSPLAERRRRDDRVARDAADGTRSYSGSSAGTSANGQSS